MVPKDKIEIEDKKQGGAGKEIADEKRARKRKGETGEKGRGGGEENQQNSG